MLRPTQKTALVTHKNCLDGTGSAVVFIKAGGLRENVLFRTPQKSALTAEEAAPFDEVWFVDVCPPDLSDPAGGKPWKVFDHHETNVKRHSGTPGCVFDQTCCGTSLLANHLGWRESFRLRELIDAIENYDLGRFNASKHTTQIADLVCSYSQDEMVDILTRSNDYIHIGVERPVDVLYSGFYQNRAETVRCVHSLLIKKSVEQAQGFHLDMHDGTKIWVAMTAAPHMTVNGICNNLLDGRVVGRKVPEIAVVVAYDANSVSLRSNKGGPNVAEIAESYGGGGHPNAAGFGLDRRAMRSLFELVFE